MRTNVLIVIFMFVAQPAMAAETGGGDEWRFQLTPYVWLPTISGKLNAQPPAGGGDGGGSVDIDVGPTDWLDLINGVALINGEVRKGRFAIFGDLVYLGLESDDNRVLSVGGGTIPVDADINLSTQTGFDGFTWTLAASYTLKETETSSFEVVGGVRFTQVDASIDWNLTVDITDPGGGVVLPAQGNIRDSVELWDGVVGVRGHYKLGESRWTVPYYLDAGTGSSDLTWQAMTGLAYSYGWGELLLLYRHLAYDEGTDGFLEDFELTGPAFGARFRF